MLVQGCVVSLSKIYYTLLCTGSTLGQREILQSWLKNCWLGCKASKQTVAISRMQANTFFTLEWEHNISFNLHVCLAKTQIKLCITHILIYFLLSTHVNCRKYCATTQECKKVGSRLGSTSQLYHFLSGQQHLCSSYPAVNHRDLHDSESAVIQ